MSRRNLVNPMANAVLPVNSKQIHDIIANSEETDMLYYEYEIVDRDKEEKWARKQARRHGLCLCSRWLFMIIGNAILIALTCSTCAILIYVNTPNDLTVKPLTYGQSCVTGSSNCDWLRFLVCSSEVCSCFSNRAWNGTDCVCTTDQYWDGLTCIQKPGYQQSCSSSIPCYSKFTCDPLTSTCLCPSESAAHYSRYYTGLVTDYYSGTCEPKGAWGSACNVHYVLSCQEYNGLTCSLGAGGIFTCNCYSGYYWRSDTGNCVEQGKRPEDDCTGNAANNLGCALNATLECNAVNNQCRCPTNYFWNNNTNTCSFHGGYQTLCFDNSWCNSDLNLICYSSALTQCNCPILSVNARCDCEHTHYWDGQICSPRVGLNIPCPGNYACSTGTCLYGYCLN